MKASSPLIASRAGELVELLLAARERLAEALLLEPDDALDLGGVLAQLGVGVAHLLDRRRRRGR